MTAEAFRGMTVVIDSLSESFQKMAQALVYSYRLELHEQWPLLYGRPEMINA